MTHEAVKNKAVSLLAEIGKKEDFTLEQLIGGANNKVFRVDSGHNHFLLKEYFQDHNDKRDRLKAEFSFCKFAWSKGINYVPEPLACNYEDHIAIYEFIEGRHLEPKDINKEYILSALNFYFELNKYKQTSEAMMLPIASEACFSINGHLQCVNNRIEKLKTIDVNSPIDKEASSFIKSDLTVAWERVRELAKQRAQKLGIELDAEIEKSDQCLSPSDFGFHNALLTSEYNLRFIDFEYAGWDDPAKTVCDLFCQPKVPVPMEYYDRIIEVAVSGLKAQKLHANRIDILFPVYQIKWCCILLNDFQLVGSKRREFSLGFINNDHQNSLQLKKAKNALIKASKIKVI